MECDVNMDNVNVVVVDVVVVKEEPLFSFEVEEGDGDGGPQTEVYNSPAFHPEFVKEEQTDDFPGGGVGGGGGDGDVVDPQKEGPEGEPQDTTLLRRSGRQRKKRVNLDEVDIDEAIDDEEGQPIRRAVKSAKRAGWRKPPPDHETRTRGERVRGKRKKYAKRKEEKLEVKQEEIDDTPEKLLHPPRLPLPENWSKLTVREKKKITRERTKTRQRQKQRILRELEGKGPKTKKEKPETKPDERNKPWKKFLPPKEPLPENWDSLTKQEKAAIVNARSNERRNIKMRAIRRLKGLVPKKERRKKPEEMTEEELQEFKTNQYMKYCAYKATWTKEEYFRMRARDSIKAKERYASLSQQEKTAMYLKNQERLARASDEVKQRYKDNMKRGVAKYWKKMKEERPMEYKRRAREQFVKRRDQINQAYRLRCQNETPEQREYRLMRYRVNAARKKARKELEAQGVSEEEIVAKLEQVAEQVRAQPRAPTKSVYTPRENARDKRKPRKGAMPLELLLQLEEVEKALAPPRKKWPSRYDPKEEEEEEVPQIDFFSEEVVVPATQDTLLASAQPEPTPEVEGEELMMPCFSKSVCSPTSASTREVGAGDPCPLPSSFADENDPDDPLWEPESKIKHIQLVVEAPPNETDNTVDTTTTTDITLEFLEPPQGKQPKKKKKRTQKPKKSVEEITKEQMCVLCGRSFKWHASLKMHMELVHNPNCTITTCPRCGLDCLTTRSLWNHFSKVHLDNNEEPDRIPAPPLRGKSIGRPPSSSSSGPPKPQIRFREDEVNQCEQCGKQFKQKCTLDDHIRRVHEGKGFFCELCPSSGDFQSAAKLWKHRVHRHGMTELEPPTDLFTNCIYCGEIILRGYEVHVKKQHPGKLEEFLPWLQSNPFPPKREKKRGAGSSSSGQRKSLKANACAHCGKCFTRGSLSRHLRNVHGINAELYKCTECDKEFKDRYRLVEHVRDKHKHNDVDDRLEALKLIQFDDRRRNAECTVCNLKIELSGMSSYSHAIRAHFVSAHHHVFEKMVSSAEPIFECPLCPPGGEGEKKFVSKNELNSHIASMHPDFTPQPIPKTPKGLGTKARAVELGRMSTNCRICGSIKSIEYMSTHMRIAHKIAEDSFLCEHCGVKTFLQRRYYLAHLECVHGVQLENILPTPNPKVRAAKPASSSPRKKVDGEEMEEPKRKTCMRRRKRRRRVVRDVNCNVESKKRLVVHIVRLTHDQIIAFKKDPS